MALNWRRSWWLKYVFSQVVLTGIED